PAPVAATVACRSSTTAVVLRWASASTSERPAIPPPATRTGRSTPSDALGRPTPSDALRDPRAFRRNRGAGWQRRVEPVKRRAIGADDLVLVAHVEEDVRVIERWPGADAHEFMGAD